MKKFLLMTAIVAASGSIAMSQTVLSPRVETEAGNVKVSYGQPSKRDRVIFGKLVPYGEVWRTGANKATEISFKKDATFGGKPVKAGTYTLFTIPGEKEWTFILNSELKQEGAGKYNEIKDKDVLKVTVPSETISGSAVEKLTISIQGDKLVLEWDKTRVQVPVKS